VAGHPEPGERERKAGCDDEGLEPSREPGRERCDGDHQRRGQPGSDPGPELRPSDRTAVERRRDRECERAGRGQEEAAEEEEVEPAPLEREAHEGQHRHDHGDEHDAGVEEQAEARQVVRVAELRPREEERERGPEQRDEQDLVPHPRKVGRTRCAHTPLFGSGRPADKTRMGRRTLVVDDHPLTRAALVGLLEQHDFPVVAEAGDGEEAIERARELQPDIVLLDLTMPGLGGLEACRASAAASPGSEVVV
jgi:CheY-like chemotaxis protein